jgi:hypothetical protein
MKKIILLTCIYLGIWGFAGFLFTLLAGFLICCANLPKSVFTFALLIFAVFAIVAVGFCVSGVCKRHEKLNW